MEEWQHQEQHYVIMANDLLANLDLPGRIDCLDDVGPELLVELFEAVCCDCSVGLIRPAVTEADLKHNLASIIDCLANDILHVSLSHIRPADIIAGNCEAIRNLLEIFHGLMEFLLGRSESNKADDRPAGSLLLEANPEQTQQQQPTGQRKDSRKLHKRLRHQRLHHLYHHFSPSLAQNLSKPASKRDAATSPAAASLLKENKQQQQHCHRQLANQLERIAGQAAEINEMARRLADLRPSPKSSPRPADCPAQREQRALQLLQTPLPAAADSAANGDTSDEGIVQDRSPCETAQNSRQKESQQQQHRDPQQQQQQRRLRIDQVAWLPQPTPAGNGAAQAAAAGSKRLEPRVRVQPPVQPPPQRRRRSAAAEASAVDDAAAVKGRLALLAELLASERRQLRRREAAHERLLRSLAGDLRRGRRRDDFDYLLAEDEDSIISLLCGGGPIGNAVHF